MTISLNPIATLDQRVLTHPHYKMFLMHIAMDPSVLIFDFYKSLPKYSQGHKKYTFGTFWQNKPLYNCKKLTQSH